jgi:hypothetical protein
LRASPDRKFPKKAAPDSLDLSAVLLGTTTNQIRTNTVLHGVSDMLALRAGDWKFIPANPKSKPSGMGAGANASDARFTANRIVKPMLFNLATDPNEETNLISRYPEKAAELEKQLAAIKNQP